jgi:hypothetical protein
VCGVRRAWVSKAGRKRGTYVARSELRAIWRKREGTHEATVGVQQASLLERLAIPVVEPNLLILYTRREHKKEKKRLTVMMKDEVSKARPPACTDSHQNQSRPRNLWQRWRWGWWHPPTAEDRRPSDDSVWPRPRRPRPRKWCHPSAAARVFG